MATSPQGATAADLQMNERMTYWAQDVVAILSHQWCTHFLLLVGLVGYNLVGGLVFTTIEGTLESAQAEKVEGLRNDAVQKFAEATEMLKDYETKVAEVYTENVKLFSQGGDTLNWDFTGSVFFCMTVYTTIGYGHIAPMTMIGRMLSIGYALLGVPFFLILLADYGKVLTRAIKAAWGCIRRIFSGSSRRSQRASVTNEDPEKAKEKEEEFDLPVTLALFVVLIYMLAGALMFIFWEPWTFFESFYFIFISMSTIGFGDYVPSNKMYMMASIIYFIFGLSLTSMCINVEKLVSSFSKASSKLGTKMGFEVVDDLAEHDESPTPDSEKEKKK